jgi:hypothetical protein
MPKVTCVHCGAQNDPDEAVGYCDECGKKLQGAYFRETPARHASTYPKSRHLLALLFTLPVIAGFVVSISMVRDQMAFSATAKEADGVVLHSFQPSRRSPTHVTVRFVVNNETVEFRDLASASHEVGEHVKVLYQPEETSQARIKYDGTWATYRLPILASGVGVVYLLVFGIYWRKDVVAWRRKNVHAERTS